MVRRASSHGRLRPLGAATAVAATLIVPLALSAGSAAGDEPLADGAAPVTDAAAPPAEPPASAPVTVEPAPIPAHAPAEGAASTVTVSRATASAQKSVAIVDFEFEPADVTIRTGDSVFWTNVGTADEGHDVAFDDFASETLPNGGTYSHTFKAAGTFAYICSIHPKMEGTVTVLERSSGGSNQNAGGSGSGDGSGSGSSDDGLDSTAESSGTAGSSGAGGSSGGSGGSGSLPATGQDLIPMTLLAAVLIGLGLGMRAVAFARRPRTADAVAYGDWLPELPAGRG